MAPAVNSPPARPGPSSADDVINREVTSLRRAGRRRRRLDVLLAIATPVALLAAWQLAAEQNWIDPAIFTPPSGIAAAAGTLASNGVLFTDLGATVARLMVGYVIGATSGTLVGLIMGLTPPLRAAFGPLFTALYAVPQIALLPLLLVIFGIGETAKVLTVVAVTFFVLQINASAAVRALDPRLLEVGTAYRATGQKLVRHVILPACTPAIFTGLRVSIALGLVVITAVEFVASNSGLGFLVWNSWQLFEPAQMYVGLVMIALVGVVLTALIALLERAALPWLRRGARLATPSSVLLRASPVSTTHPLRSFTMTTAATGNQPATRKRRPSRSGRTLLAGLGSAAAAALLLSACGSSSSSSPGAAGATKSASTGGGLTSVTVAYVPVPLFEPLFVAMHDGYFTRHGIDVHLTEVGSGQSATTLAATNKVQAVMGGFSAGMFNAIHQGLDFKVVGSMAEEAPGTPANALVGAESLDKSGAVTSPAALKGKKIAVDGGAGSTGAYLVAKDLAPYHVSLSQVTLVNLDFPEMASALHSGAVAAAFMTAPFLGSAVSSGAGKILASAPVGVAATGVIYGGAFAKTPAAQQFFDALVEAAGQLQGKQASSAANLAIVAKATGETLSALEAEPANQFSPDLAPPVSLLNDMQSVFLGSKDLNYSAPIASSTYVDGTFSANAG
ncbi:MAG TPA: ABC transporter permease subunit [Trebonia sp.]